MSWHAKFSRIWIISLACLMVCREALRAYDWQPPTNKIAVLAVWAHPDDEGIFGGGTLPYYSTVLKVPTMLLCMTAGGDTVRDDELRCAAWNYGLRYEPLFGHFMDVFSSSMTSTPYGTNTINVTWDYWAGVGFRGDGTNAEAGKARAISFVAEQIRRYRPDVIITHDLNGETGHDNHKATAYAVTQAFAVAADLNAMAANLVGLPPWQAQKLYVHLYPTNQLFHEFWETPYPALADQTPYQVANLGLTCHVSQGPSRWIGASVYPPGGLYNLWPSEWWGLYASLVGPDTLLSSNAVVNGYTVPPGVAAGDFLEHLSDSELYFTAIPNSATISAGSSITLSAAAAATLPPLGYQWQFNGAGIGGATDASLTLSNVQPVNAGSYTVVVTNTAGLLTSPAAVLTVFLPQVITCASNKSVECTDAWNFDAPSATGPAGTTTITVLSTTTNRTCGAGYVATRAWQGVDAFGNRATCTQVVTVVDTMPPVILCPSNLTVECSSPWSFGTPVAPDHGLGSALVYDNSVNDVVTPFDPGTNEVGNEIMLAGDERYVQGFSYEFWSTNVAGSSLYEGKNVTVRLRFYANGGTNFNGYPVPGKLLYDSGDFWLGMETTPRSTVIYDEYDLGLYALYPLTVVLPPSFTWTVQFSGLCANDRAGVDLYSPPVIGQSYGDFWLRTDGGWQLRMNPGVNMDIAARARASTNQVTITLLSTVTNATFGNGFVVTQAWRAADACGNFSDCSQTVTVVDTTAPVITHCPTNRSLSVGTNFLLALPDFTGELAAADAYSQVSVSQSPPPGTDLGLGEHMITFTASDAASNSATCALTLTVGLPVSADTNSSFISNITLRSDGAVQLGFIGFLGASYTLQSSTNLTDWEIVASLVSFEDGQFGFVDSPATNYPARFFRLSSP